MPVDHDRTSWPRAHHDYRSAIVVRSLGCDGDIVDPIEGADLVIVWAEQIDGWKQRSDLGCPLDRIAGEQVDTDQSTRSTGDCCGFDNHLIVEESLGATDMQISGTFDDLALTVIKLQGWVGARAMQRWTLAVWADG
jgi:hypothetical protein